ncbi:hypothetical protein K2X33_13520 [bacterium]|nr:hypothetical protein [bacterium]
MHRFALLAAVFLAQSDAWGRLISLRDDMQGPRAVLDTEVAYSDREDQLAPVALHFRMAGFDLDRNSEGFHYASSEGLVPLGQVGAPDVPTTGVILAIPEGVEPKLTVTSQKTKNVEYAPLRPCLPSQRCSPTQPEIVRFDSQVYESGAFFPQANVQLEEVGHLQNTRLVRVAIYPLQMHMRKQSLVATSDLRVQVEFDGTPRPVEATTGLSTLLRQATANADVLPTREITQPEKMLILCADSLRQEIEPLVQWKRQRGLEVEVKTLAEVGGTRSKAQAYLKNYYNRSADRPTYLLFVGNNTTMPGFREDTSAGPAATDYTYSLLEGGDAIPDILYGRLLADTAAEARTQVKRWVDYEKNPAKGWPTRGLTVASKDGVSPSDVQYAQQVQAALGKSITQFDELKEGDGSASPTRILNSLQDGKSWVAYFGHGSGVEWASTTPWFNLKSVAKIDNAGKLPFVVDVACDNASWVDMKKCFGKAWMTLEDNGDPKGAVAYYGGSVSISWHEPAIMSIGIAKYHFEKPVYSIGGSALAGQLYLMEKMGVRKNTIDNLRWYNLFGDPSLILHTDDAKPYQVKRQTILSGAVEVMLNTVDAFGEPLPHVRASLTAPGRDAPIAVGNTDANGELTLATELPTLPKGTVLTTSGYNLESYEYTLKP